MTLTATRPQMFIDGDRTDAASGETMAVINPATEEEIAQVPKGDASDVDRAVAAARAAFESWSQSTPQDRSKALFAFADAIEGDAETLSSLEQANVGKPKGTADFDVEFTVDNIRFFAGAARVVEGKAAGEYISTHTSMLRREAAGVVGQVAPWNYPLMMAIWKLGPALAAGCTVVLKPASMTPLSALRIAELAADIFPKGVFNVVTGPGGGRRGSAHPSSGRRHGVADRRHGDRQGDRGRRGADREARAPRARRQGSGARLRRRRHGRPGRDDQAGRLLQLGPGLHGRHAADRDGRRVRPRARGAGAGRGVDQGRRPRLRPGARHGTDGEPGRSRSASPGSSTARAAPAPRSPPAARRSGTAATSIGRRS